jgi:WD40 repeat protein/predicted Ser/Thr protein kinase
MNPESNGQSDRAAEIKRLFLAAQKLAPDKREAFLSEACAGDEALHDEVESLLKHWSTSDSFLAEPAAKLLAREIATDQPVDLSGRQPGHYLIQEEIGRGGMGVVYRARDTSLEREVAIKVLPAEFTADAERARRFEQEARTISALRHPNIITIHEIGRSDELQFIVTELIEGRTLRRVITEAQPGWRKAVLVAAQIADALDAAHRAGIIHRDIKPENVMVGPDWQVKVLDFGIAKRVFVPAEGEAANGPVSFGDQTRTGVIAGTLNYLSPEQARGEPLDARTDIFSFGIVLYEMLAGRRPYDGLSDEAKQVALADDREIPPISKVCPQLPAALYGIVTRALRKKRDDRYASAGEMLAELSELKSLIEVSDARTVRTQNANRLLNQFVVRYLADEKTRIPTGALWTIRRYADLKRGPLEREVIRKSLVGIITRFGLLILLVAAMTLCVAAWFSVNPDWKERILRDGHTAAVWRAIFSPDKQRLVSVSEDNRVMVWDFARRERLKTLTDHTGWVTSVAFSPDGKLMATGSHDSTVIVWDAAKFEKLRTLREHRDAVNAVAFSPNGRLLASVSGNGGSASPDFRTVVWDTGSWEKLREMPHGVEYGPVLFSPDSRLLIINSVQWNLISGHRVIREEGENWNWNWAEFSPDFRRLAGVRPGGDAFFRELAQPGEVAGGRHPGEFYVHQDFGRAVAFSPDGKLVATGAENIALWDAAAMKLLGRFDYDSIVWSVTFSPDGRWLVSAHGDGSIQVWDVADRRSVVGFNGHSNAVRAVAYSPDGKRIASAGEDQSVILWDAGSGRKETVLTGHETRVVNVAFSPDGNWLVSFDQDGWLIRWDVEKRTPQWKVKTMADSGCLTISPDGKWVATPRTIHESVEGNEVMNFQERGFHLLESATFSGNGKLMFGVGYAEARLLDTRTWQLIAQQQEDDLFSVAAAFAPDSRRMVSGSVDGTVMLWDAEPLRKVGVLDRHAARIKSLAFSPDGETVASAGDDKMIALWDVSSRKQIARIGTHATPVYSIAFSPDGRQLVSGEHDRSVRLYTRRRTLWGWRLD